MFNQKPDNWQWRVRKGAQTRRISYDQQSCRGTALEWVSGEQVRIPQEKTRIFRRGIPILAAGRPYAGTALLTFGKPPADGWTTDCYGRQIYCYRERFPCFDSCDLIHENRYFRWFFIYQDGRLTRIYTEDEQKAVYVTEDVAFLENMFWEKLEESGYFDRK